METTVRVRTRSRTFRLEMTSSDLLFQLKDLISNETGVSPLEQKLSLDPAGRVLLTNEGRTLSELGLRNGVMVYLTSVPDLGAKGQDTVIRLHRGELVRMLRSEVEAKEAELARMEAKEKEEEATAEKEPEDLEWLCSHPPDKMCINCMPFKKGEEKMLEMLCQHGPGQKCVNCVKKPTVENRKHISFKEYLLQQRVKCQHKKDAMCNNCIPPSLVSYKMKSNCRRHRPWPRGLCTECSPPPATVNRQPYRHVDFVSFTNPKEVQRFAEPWVSSGYHLQRAGLLIGRYAPDSVHPEQTRAVVEAVYEPPQMEDAHGVKLLEDPKHDMLKELVAAMGLDIVGWIFTHRHRKLIATSQELRRMATLQVAFATKEHAGSRFVTVALSPNEAGSVEPEAMMASDQCMALERDGVLGESDNPGFFGLAEVSATDPPLPKILRHDKDVGSQHVAKFECEFCLVQVGSGVGKEAGSKRVFKHCSFPVENRNILGGRGQTADAVTEHMRSIRAPLASRLSDFHLLLYLADLFDPETVYDTARRIAEKMPMSEGMEALMGQFE